MNILIVKDSLNYSGQPVLGQPLSFIPKEIITEAVKAYQSDKWYKKVKTWDQFVFMFFAIPPPATPNKITLPVFPLSVVSSIL
ncbi:MAG: DUF4372 domain-containing protein [Cyclobacteriaceae bacterium]|nr:DUF4372 domain-containing protein [Cyclobacteriaceae bacterium]